MLRYSPGSPRGGAGGMDAMPGAADGAGGGGATLVAQPATASGISNSVRRRIIFRLLHQRNAYDKPKSLRLGRRRV